MLLFYIRHGDPIYSPDSLTPLGERQAESVAKRLALFGIDEVYSSSSNRAMQTALPTCEITKKELKILDFLNENNITEHFCIPMEGSKPKWVWAHPDTAELLLRRDVREMGDEWYKHPEFEKYHYEDMILPINRQIDEFIASHGYEHDKEKGLYRVKERHAEKRIAIFAHECMAKLFFSHVLDIPFPYYAEHFEMKHTGMTVVRFDDGASAGGDTAPRKYARARVLTLSNDSHLYRDGLPLKHVSTRIRDRY
jgi:probable phosphoglycerate mutase